MMALPHDPSMSVEEYLQLDRSSIETRYEYIDGYVAMLAGGTLDHATIGANIISILRHSLRGSSCRVFTSYARVRLSRTRFVYPDATVSCDEELELTNLGVHFAVSEVYEDAIFPPQIENPRL